MARTCTVCSHPDRAEIDRALVGGEPCAAVAARYRTELGRMAVQRHRGEHVPELLAYVRTHIDRNPRRRGCDGPSDGVSDGAFGGGSSVLIA